MTAQETKLFNAFETTLATTMGSSDTTLTVAAVTDSYPTTLSAPFYIVINPDSATNREVILVTAVDTGTKQLTTSVPNRYLPGSAASSGLSHASGQVVRMTPLQQHMEDINDRVDTIINEAGTAVNTSLFLDEDDMASDSATKGVTQQSVKAYVDSQVTAQDLDFAGDTGTGAVDLDSQTFTIAGTANEIETSASAQTITIGLPSTITTTLSGTSVLSDGVTATTQASNDNSTKVATTAYVDAQVTAEDLDITTDSGSIAIDLDSEILTVAGGAGIDTSAATNTVTIAIDSTVATLTGTQTLTNKTISGSSNTLSNIANASLTNSSITVSDSETVPNTSPIALGGTLTFAGTANEVTVLESAGTVTISLPTNISVDVTGDLTGNVTATSVLADGVTATTQTAGDNSTKVATTAYVDAIDVDDDLTVSDGTTSTVINLDSQTFSILGTASQITATTSAQTITLSLPATINVDTSGNAATATALETARTIAGVSFDGTANINIPIDNLSDVVLTTPSSGQVLEYNGTNWINATPTVGDITGVTAGDGLSGGGTSGDVSLALDLNELTSATVDVATDSIAIVDATDNSSKKETIADLAAAMADGTTITATNGVLSSVGGGGGVSLGLVLALG